MVRKREERKIVERKKGIRFDENYCLENWSTSYHDSEPPGPSYNH